MEIFNFNWSLISIDAQIIPSLSSIIATVTEGESYAKLLGLAMSITGLSIFLGSRIFGELAVRLGFPAVLGNLIAGLVLGVSGLHFLVLENGSGAEISALLINICTTATGASVETVKEVFAGPVQLINDRNSGFGVGILLFSIGLESDLKELLKVGVQSASVAVVGVILPFLLGFVGLTTFFGVPALPALFAGAALTATSIGITAKVMQDIGVLKSKEGQIILGAAILDDILGIVILAVVVSIVETGKVEVSNVALLILSASLFVIAAILLNRFFGSWFVAQLEKLKNPGSVGTGAFIFFIIMSTIAGLIGLESILGAFAAGLVLGGTKYREQLEEQAGVLVGIFATIFFVCIGAKTDLSVLNPAIPANREGLVIAVFLIIVAIIGKVIAGFCAISSEKINRLAIGTGMVPRGEVGLVFAGLGAATGALPQSIDVAIILMVIATTFLSPPLLRLVFDSRESITSQSQSSA